MAKISRQRMAGDIDHSSGGGCPRDGGSSHRGGVDVPPGIGECTCNNDEYHEDQDERGAFLDEDDWAEELEIDEAEQGALKKTSPSPIAGPSKSGRAYQEISRQVAGFIVLFHI